ncbi:FadR/GntR family transcriptional regulator [Thalassotalea nanhaiensis]|uniref:FadR/GntR family transcriptional regulator n=1 Tax=Thalassotalea nanhaiensis TaxID=3065648 RepID=A0ABY9TDQ7_9GAMM|nr:FadR/GntR family transcriptional regulator [Colwelliaceae bacterium SQ345]
MKQAASDTNKRKDNLVDNAMSQIIDFIKLNQLRVGDKLPSESYFIEQLMVSRTVVREAFKSLDAMSIIAMSAGKKAQVGTFDDSVIGITLSHALRTEQINVQQIWDARRAIELRTVELAAIHRSQEQSDKIANLAVKMRESYTSLNEMTEYDIKFHKLIAEATNNPIFPVLIASLAAAIRDTNPILWKVRQSKPQQVEVVELHENVAKAIVGKDPQAAIEAMANHFDVASAWLLKAGFN